jgi:hypothetical protein
MNSASPYMDARAAAGRTAGKNPSSSPYERLGHYDEAVDAYGRYAIQVNLRLEAAKAACLVSCDHEPPMG